jgi:hypothetical protein
MSAEALSGYKNILPGAYKLILNLIFTQVVGALDFW